MLNAYLDIEGKDVVIRHRLAQYHLWLQWQQVTEEGVLEDEDLLVKGVAFNKQRIESFDPIMNVLVTKSEWNER